MATILGNLAALYRSQHNYEEAERIYRRAVAVAESALGNEHLRVAQSLEAYASLLNETNRQERAQELSLRANAIRTKHSNQ